MILKNLNKEPIIMNGIPFPSTYTVDDATKQFILLAAPKSRWRVIGEGNFESISLLRYVLEKIKGWIGLGNAAHSKAIEFEFLRLIRNSIALSKIPLQQDTLSLIDSAARAVGLIQNSPTNKKEHSELSIIIDSIREEILGNASFNLEVCENLISNFYLKYEGLLKRVVIDPHRKMTPLFLFSQEQEKAEDPELNRGEFSSVPPSQPATIPIEQECSHSREARVSTHDTDLTKLNSETVVTPKEECHELVPFQQTEKALNTGLLLNAATRRHFLPVFNSSILRLAGFQTPTKAAIIHLSPYESVLTSKALKEHVSSSVGVKALLGVFNSERKKAKKKYEVNLSFNFIPRFILNVYGQSYPMSKILIESTDSGISSLIKLNQLDEEERAEVFDNCVRYNLGVSKSSEKDCVVLHFLRRKEFRNYEMDIQELYNRKDNLKELKEYLNSLDIDNLPLTHNYAHLFTCEPKDKICELLENLQFKFTEEELSQIEKIKHSIFRNAILNKRTE